MKSRRTIKRISVIFFITILICTFLSKTLNNFLLPEVQMVDIKSGSLDYSINTEGRVSYAKVENIAGDKEWVVEKILVNSGQIVKEGQALAKVDLSKIKVLQEQKKLEIMNMEYDIKTIKNSEKVDMDLLKIKQFALEIANNQYTAISDGINDQGEIVSPTKGIITKISSDQNITTGDGSTLFEVSDNTSNYCIKWSLSNEQAVYLKTGININISVEGSSEIKNVQANIISKKYIEDKDIYEFTAELNSEQINDKSLEVQQRVLVGYTSNKGSYDRIIPKESVIEKSDGSKIVYVVKEKEGTFGIENYIAEQNVKIVDSDNSNYAIDDIISDARQVVYTTSKSIENGTKVKLAYEK